VCYYNGITIDPNRPKLYEFVILTGCPVTSLDMYHHWLLFALHREQAGYNQCAHWASALILVCTLDIFMSRPRGTTPRGLETSFEYKAILDQALLNHFLF
jgi:hypothetical protein